MFDEVSKINKIKECKEKFELPRTLARENYKHFDLPRNHFSDVKSEVKEDTFELSRKIVNDVEKNIAKTLEEKIIDGKPLQFKDIKNYLVYPSLKETITASAYASSVLMALKKTNPELVKVDAKSLEKDLDKFYNSNLKEISRNNDDIVEKLKSNDFAKKTLEVTTSLIYISGKLILDAGVAIENGLNVGLDSAAKFFDQPILDDINFDLFSNLSNEFSVYFKDLENLKQLDNFILALEEIPLTIAELYLTIYASSIYLATKIVLGAGHVVEDSLKFILEGGAFLFGQEEFAKKVQKSHIVNDISKVVDDSLNDSLKFLDKISKMTNVSKVVNPLHQVGKIGEIVGELGTEISLTIGSLATGNIPLAVCLIAISACNVGGEAVDLAVEKTGEFTWKEMMFGVAVAAVDAVAYGISRNITSYGLKVTQNFTKSFEKFIGNSVLGGIDASIFELSNIIKPLLENQLEIDKKAKIDWKQIGINTGFGFVLGGILPAVAEVINVNKLKKIEKIKKEYSVIVDQLKKGSSIENTKLKKLVGKKTFDIIKKGDDKLLDTFKKLPEETAEAIKLYGKKYTEILSNLTRVKERTVYTRLMAEKNGDKLLRFLNSLDTKDQISMLKKFAYDGFEKSYLLLDSVPFKKIYRKPKLFDTEYKKISKIISNIEVPSITISTFDENILKTGTKNDIYILIENKVGKKFSHQTLAEFFVGIRKCNPNLVKKICDGQYRNFSEIVKSSVRGYGGMHEFISHSNFYRLAKNSNISDNELLFLLKNQTEWVIPTRLTIFKKGGCHPTSDLDKLVKVNSSEHSAYNKKIMDAADNCTSAIDYIKRTRKINKKFLIKPVYNMSENIFNESVELSSKKHFIEKKLKNDINDVKRVINKNNNSRPVNGNFTESDKSAIEKGIPLFGNDDFKESRIGKQWDDSEKGYLKPNYEYTAGENNYSYKTDAQGRVIHAEAHPLKEKPREDRIPHNSQSPEKIDGDDAGHIIGDQFGGSPDIDNIFSQEAGLNRGEYKKLESYFRNQIKDGNKVECLYDLKYEDVSRRPSDITVSYRINDGDWCEQIFINTIKNKVV